MELSSNLEFRQIIFIYIHQKRQFSYETMQIMQLFKVIPGNSFCFFSNSKKKKKIFRIHFFKRKMKLFQWNERIKKFSNYKISKKKKKFINKFFFSKTDNKFFYG